MPKLEIKATELVGTDVNFVSLVKRGANRIPFRITKGEEPMLDLHKIGRTLFKKSDPKPEIVAAIVQKGADMTALAGTFKDAGLDPKAFTKSEKDGIITVARTDAAEAEGTVVIKASDEIAFVVSHMKKAFVDYDPASAGFLEVLKSGESYPSLCTARDALGSTISAILYEAATPADAASRIAKSIDEFKGYVTAMASSLPVHAFKMEVALAKAGGGKNGTGAGFQAGRGTGTLPSATADDAAHTAVNATGAESTTGNDTEEPVEARKAEIKGLPQPTGFEPGDDDGFAASPEDTQRAVAHASADDKKMKLNGGTRGSSIPDRNSGLGRLGGVHKNDGDDEIGKKGTGNELPEDQSGAGAQSGKVVDPTAADLTKSDNRPILEAIAALQNSVTATVNMLKGDITGLTNRVDQVATLARKTDAALNGTVFNEAGGDPAKINKAEAAEAIPLLDTAYSRRSAA